MTGRWAVLALVAVLVAAVALGIETGTVLAHRTPPTVRVVVVR